VHLRVFGSNKNESNEEVMPRWNRPGEKRAYVGPPEGRVGFGKAG